MSTSRGRSLQRRRKFSPEFKFKVRVEVNPHGSGLECEVFEGARLSRVAKEKEGLS